MAIKNPALGGASEINRTQQWSSTIGLLIKRLWDKLKAAGLSCISAKDKETLTGR